jgi:hypothetical protein
MKRSWDDKVGQNNRDEKSLTTLRARRSTKKKIKDNVLA